MRNLKKFLALALAMVMAFSLVLSANALDKYNQVKEWDDKDQVTEEFVEAVDVLSGMKIYQGDARGFAPGDTITRAETAALIYRLATGDVANVRNGLYANYGNFADVNEGDWFAGYVGYCANAGYIKGHNGYFNPYAPVTGYEALAMILRAVGYDKNHEFEGATWQTNVSALGTRLGVLDDVRTSDYGNTLHLASRRDVVASILFACAQLDTVTYTPALGYETGSFGVDKTSLGVKNFGLKSVTGIIVGNQDTGESMTRINKVKVEGGKAVAPDYYAYFHQTKNYNVWSTASTNADKVMETTVTTTIDAKTGVEMFGHKVKAWYCSDTATGAKKGNTFALYDQAVKTALVTVGASTGDINDARLSGSAGSTSADNAIGKAAQAAGFSVDLASSQAVFNQSFGISGVRLPTGSEGIGDGWVVDNGTDPLYVTDYNSTGDYAQAGEADARSDSLLGSDNTYNYPLYLLISNNSAKTVDMVIALNVETSKVVQVNNYATHQTVTVPQVSTGIAFNKDGQSNRIAQGALTATSDKALGDGVVAINIVGTKVTNDTIEIGGNNYAKLAGYTQPVNSPLAANGETSLFRLSKPTQVVEGLVTQYKGSDPKNTLGRGVTHTGSIVIDGQTIERSLLADAIVSHDTTDATDGSQIKAVGLSATANTYQKYRAYLDEEGKYIWVEPVNERTFIYGTYIDYQTPYGSSAYEYTVVGVNDKGEQVKQVVKTFNGNAIGSNNYRIIGQWDNNIPNATDVGADSGLPFRDTTTSVAGVTPGLYSGMTLGSNGDLLSNDIGRLGWTMARNAVDTAFSGAGSTDTVITSTDARLGMKETGKGTGASDSWYITENTKIIAVSGAGTDTQKAVVFNGITDLLDGASSVIIRNATAVSARGVISDKWVDGSTPHTLNYSDMMYYTQSNFTYASNVSRAKQIDTLILPMDALGWTGRSNLYFIGNNEKTSEIQVGTNWYTQFTMYKDGVAENVWVEGRETAQDNGFDTSARTISGHDQALGNEWQSSDRFYKLVNSGMTLPDGTTVYMIEGRRLGAGGSAGTYVSVADYDANGRPDVNGIAAGSAQEPIIWGGTYWAATKDAQTATINPDTATSNSNSLGVASGFSTSASNAKPTSYKVSNATVVNLNAADSPLVVGENTGYIWNGIADLGTLNDAASTSVIFTNGNRQPVVSCLVDPADPLNVIVIYVHWNQNIGMGS